jgi:fumarate reductase subunit C
MSTGYKLHHPRWHRRRIPIFWWLGKLSYTKFIVRELTSLAVLWAALLLLAQAWVLGSGEQAYQRFEALLRSPLVVALNALALTALLFHSVTWLGLAPKAMVVRLGRRRLPDGVILLAHYAAWLAVSVLLAWGLLGR